MNCELTQEIVETYRRDGFLHVPGLLSPEEVSHWKREIERASDERTERIPSHDDGGKTGNEYYDRVFKQRVNLWQSDEAVAELVLDPAIAGMAARLEGLDSVSLWHDQALIKQPWANPTSWHIDDPYWSFYTRKATTCWTALEDVTLQNGALYFLPGTHETATYDNVLIGQNMNSLFDVYPDWAKIEPVPVEMKAGDCSFHNGLTAHAAGPNMTTGTRAAFSIIYMPADATYNGIKNVLPPRLLESLEPGAPLNDPQQNPIVFPRDGAYVAVTQ